MTRQPAAKQFAQAKTYDVQRVDRDASAAVTRTTRMSGQVSETFDGSEEFSVAKCADPLLVYRP